MNLKKKKKKSVLRILSESSLYKLCYECFYKYKHKTLQFTHLKSLLCTKIIIKSYSQNNPLIFIIFKLSEKCPILEKKKKSVIRNPW